MDITTIKHHFPIFEHLAQNGETLHYLDNAATAHKPTVVTDAITEAYLDKYGPVSRGLYPLSAYATEGYEAARNTIGSFIGANAENIIFTRSATESLNMVAQGAVKKHLTTESEVWISDAEHHANFLPWQRVCHETGATLRLLTIDENGKLELPPLSDLKSGKVKCISLSLVSNVLGFYADVAAIIELAKQYNVFTVVDAAQAIAHHPIDMSQLHADFLAFSGHKMYGPTGIGVLYVNEKCLSSLDPHLVGGGMVDWVGENFEDTQWTPGVAAFEGGSPNYAGACGIAAAAKFIESQNRPALEQHISELAIACGNAIRELPQYLTFGDESNWRAGMVTFAHQSIHPHDIAQVCADNGVAVRAGHHCAQPLMKKLGQAATVRASFGIYNDSRDIEALIMSLIKAEAMFL